jgi:hypothetical protein
MATKVRLRSRCQFCHRPCHLCWYGWTDLNQNGTHDLCPGTMAAVHQPVR